MPPSAEEPAPATDAARLLRAVAAFQDDRLDEAETLLANVGPDVHHLQHYWQVRAAMAARRGTMADAADAQARACALYCELHGMESHALLLDLLRMSIAARQGQAALEARNRAAAAIVALPRTDRAQASEARAVLDRLEKTLSALLWEEGQQDAAITAQVRHVASVPDDVVALRQLRRALTLRDRLAEALLVQMRVALLEPEAPGPARDMGRILRALGAGPAARTWFRRALRLQPEDAAAQALLEEAAEPSGGAADQIVGRLVRPMEGLGGAPGDPVWPMAVARALEAMKGLGPAEAAPPDWAVLVDQAILAVLRRVLVLRPDHAEAATTLASLLRETGDDAALGALRGALKLSPRDAGLHVRLGFELHKQGQMVEAQRSFRTALSLNQDLLLAMIGLAAALQGVGPSTEALALVERARALDPSATTVHALLVQAVALQSLLRMEEAVAAYEAVLEAAPEHDGAKFGLGLAFLAMGRLEKGWPLYALRWRTGATIPGARAPHDPLARPDPAMWQGKTVLVYAEQAQGDTIQFLRYARLVAASGARVLLEVPGSLKRLAETLPDLAGVYSRGEMIPPFDIAMPLLHLPWAFGTTLETIPAVVPYLRGDLTRAAGFRRRLAGLPGLKVGLVWSGDPRPDMPDQALMDERRSVKLKDLAPLAKVPGVVFVSLQKGVPAAQAAEPPAGMVLHDWTEELADFTDTAALMTALDLVITVDTAPAHLAGALARPVWLLNRFDTDFRWLLDRGDSPWYPTLRQFRQVRPGAWGEVIERVAAALHEKAGRGA
ncbi:MAG: hypothetical protein NTY94_13290 [Alphaproteobacteria bacterium]|nr:hypothetical protein [Alphaproteobacteria bacterium]